MFGGGHHGVNCHSDPSTFIPGEIKMNNNLMDSFPAQGRASLAKNFSDGKSPELEGITGTLARLGRETGIPTPVNDASTPFLNPRHCGLKQTFR